jgi:hypothetical protein
MDQTSASEKALQSKKYEEIVDLLLGAGYFRARIASLSEFDKVVGGLCWCITWSGEDVDSDLLFRENSTIGQKIALSEAIVRALRKMKCPASIQPHQIQGGVGGADYSAILPVIVWLIKKFFELKTQRDLELRKYSMLQFSRNLNVSNEGDVSSKDLQAIASRKKIVRAFRRVQKKNESEEVKVRSCLIEYGETFGSGGPAAAGGSGGSGGSGGAGGSGGSGGSGGAGGSGAAGGSGGASGGGKGFSATDGGADASGGFSATGEVEISSTIVVNTAEGKGKGGVTFNVILPDSDVALAAAKVGGGRGGDLSAFEEKFATALREASKEEQLLSIEASKQEAALLKQMQQISADEDDVVVSGAQIGNIVGLGSSSIGSAAAAYEAAMEEARKQLDTTIGGGKLGQAVAFKRQQQALQTSIEERKIEVVSLQAKMATSSQKLHLLLQERDEAAKYTEQLKAQITKLESIEVNGSQRNELAMLKNLVALNESLRGQEAAFKASCKAQLADLNARIKAIGESSAVGANQSEEEKKFAEVEEMHSKVCNLYFYAW